MRRIMLTIGITLAMLILATQVQPSVHAQTPSITVTPASGSQFDVFTFVGSGFVPGTELEETYISPDGEVFTFYIGGEPAIVFVGADGSFSVEVRPNVDFQGAREGRWTVSFCIVGGSDCWVGTIDIAA
jgi:hypothetical protein